MTFDFHTNHSADRWLDMAPAGWPVARLRFRAKINPSRSQLNGVVGDTQVSFVPMEAVGEYGGLRLEEVKPLDEVSTGYTYFREGDIVVAKITPCFENGKGSVAEGLVNGLAFGTTELHVLRPLGHMDGRFLFYLTVSHAFRSIGAAFMYGAGGQKRVPDDFVKNFRHPIPTLGDQRAIAAFLDRETARIDALIAKKQRQIELLQEKRAALITQAVTKGLDPNARMKDSGVEWLGEVPQHWRVARLRHLLTELQQGWSPQCEEREAENHEWAVMKAGCANYGRFDEKDHKALPAGVEPEPRFEICPGDLLMSRACGTPSLVGSVAYVTQCRPKLLLCDKLFRLRTREELCLPQFLYFVLNSSMARFQIEQSISGAEGLANNITQPTIKNLFVALPSSDEQKLIVEKLLRSTDRLGSVVSIIDLSIEQLREYRTALVSAAVTGKIDVREAAA